MTVVVVSAIAAAVFAAGYVTGRLHARMLRVIADAPIAPHPPPPAFLELDWEDPRGSRLLADNERLIAEARAERVRHEAQIEAADRRFQRGLDLLSGAADITSRTGITSQHVPQIRDVGATRDRPRLGVASNVVPISEHRGRPDR